MVQIINIDIATKTITGDYIESNQGIKILEYVIKGLLWSCFNIEANDYYRDWQNLNIKNNNSNQVKSFSFKWPY